MARYLIAYELGLSSTDALSLIGAIQQLGISWQHFLETAWIIETVGTANQIRDALVNHLAEGDVLFISKVTTDVAWCGLDEECTKWLDGGAPAARHTNM